MREYFNPAINLDTLRLSGNMMATKAARFDPAEARKKLLKNEFFDQAKIIPFLARPFDRQHCYFTAVRPVWNEPRPTLWSQYEIPENTFLISRVSRSSEPEGVPFFFGTVLGDDHMLRTDASFIARMVVHDGGPLIGKTITANLSPGSRAYLTALGFEDPDQHEESAGAVWWHSLAVGFSPEYLNENDDGIAVDWPRIPLPVTRSALEASVSLGRRLVRLLDGDADVDGVTAGDVAQPFRSLGGVAAANLDLTAGWGRKDTKGRVNGAEGRVEAYDWDEAECGVLVNGFVSEGVVPERGLQLLGPPLRVYLNDTNFWRGVPSAVWNFHIGGYQVIKKWLSYREHRVLGRALTRDEAREVTAMVRRIAAIILMTDELNANYQAVKANVWPWPRA